MSLRHHGGAWLASSARQIAFRVGAASCGAIVRLSLCARAAARRRVAAIGAAAIAGVCAAACAPAIFTRPTGPGAPAPDAVVIWRDAVAACRGVTSYRATLVMSGRVAGSRIPHVTIGVALDARGDIAMQARVAGPLLFSLAGSAARATLLFDDGRHVVTAPAAAIVDALIGVRIEPARLLAVLTGCVSRDGTFVRAARYGDVLDVTTSDADVYLARQDGGWRARAGAFDAVLVNYSAWTRDRDAWPAALTMGTAAGQPARLAAAIRVTDVRVNADLDPSLFTLSPPPDAEPMSIDALRADGLIGGR